MSETKTPFDIANNNGEHTMKAEQVGRMVTLPNGKIALVIKDNLDSFDDNGNSPKFSRMIAYGTSDKWLWVHKNYQS